MKMINIVLKLEWEGGGKSGAIESPIQSKITSQNSASEVMDGLRLSSVGKHH